MTVDERGGESFVRLPGKGGTDRSSRVLASECWYLAWMQRYAPVLITLFMAFGCTPEPTQELPMFLQELTGRIEAEDEAESPGSIWRYRYLGDVVYYVPPLPCCDQLSTLYDENGGVLCAPDGGITGDGNGQCPDFFELRSEETRVWQDSRVHGS
jgi:hypothetical protein